MASIKISWQQKQQQKENERTIPSLKKRCGFNSGERKIFFKGEKNYFHECYFGGFNLTSFMKFRWVLSLPLNFSKILDLIPRFNFVNGQ